MTDIRQAIGFYAFGSKPLGDLLELKVPPFARTKDALRQLRYIEAYVKELNCATVVVEGHYIDRDHIEDHGVFYSRNFVSYPNYCQRLHFFSQEEMKVKEELRALAETGKKDASGYRVACEAFSERAYLGWAVVKPLHGCPVGRTVLRTYQGKGKECRRVFPCVRRHRAHLLSVELPVYGMPFQQQDTGVSACATTAIWAALHHFREFEEVAAATPAQITNTASRFSLPFGRPMPSEGLSVEQMCQAIQGMGVSPHMHKAVDYSTAQSLIYSATMSGMASVLICQRNNEGVTERHAVAVAGIKLAEPFTPTGSDGVAEQATQLMGAYVHDDRWGPYVSTVFENKGGKALLHYLERGVITQEESWELTHVLIPMHAKIRLSFSGLQEVAMEVATWVKWYVVTQLKLAEPEVLLDSTITRGYRYVEELLFEPGGLGVREVEEFSSVVSLPRYVGLIRVRSELMGTIDVLLDTTGTVRNLHCSAIVCRTPKAERARAMGDFLAKKFEAFPKAFGFVG